MISFIKPENLDGAQLRKELLDAGIEISNERGSISIESDGLLYLNISAEDKLKAETIINNHIPTANFATTIDYKLASVGLNLDDLKAALGL